MTPAFAPVQAPVAPRALVVDDEAAIRTVLRRALERRGWHVDVASDGDEALAFLGGADLPQGARYEAVIADVRMDRMGGIELHHWLAANRPDLVGRFVVSTGDATDEETSMFLEETGCRVLAKPFDLATLGAVLAGMGGEEVPARTA